MVGVKCETSTFRTGLCQMLTVSNILANIEVAIFRVTLLIVTNQGCIGWLFVVALCRVETEQGVGCDGAEVLAEVQ